MSNFKVFVVDSEGTPLLPTSQARARLLLKKEKATVYSVIPFTIQLKYKIDKPIGEFKCGIDDGAKYVGISIGYNKKVIFAGNIELRQDVKRKMKERHDCRVVRRSRKLRNRPKRFLNRGKKGFITPTIRTKKESILRVINFLKKRINITSCVIEHGQFDISSMNKGYKLIGEEYQKSEYKGNNWRQKVLFRDNYTCRKCKTKSQLQAHHIKYVSNGGTNLVSNGYTLCKDCHSKLHKGEWKLKQSKASNLKFAAHTQQGKWWLFDKLKSIFKKVNICYGWMTAKNRRRLNLEKDHHYDASAMINCNDYETNIYKIKPRRTKVWENNPTKKCTEKNGFKHYDIVKSIHRTKGIIIGSIRSLKAKVITLRTSFDNNFPVSYNKSKILWRPKGLILINNFNG